VHYTRIEFSRGIPPRLLCIPPEKVKDCTQRGFLLFSFGYFGEFPYYRDYKRLRRTIETCCESYVIAYRYGTVYRMKTAYFSSKHFLQKGKGPTIKTWKQQYLFVWHSFNCLPFSIRRTIDKLNRVTQQPCWRWPTEPCLYMHYRGPTYWKEEEDAMADLRGNM
jgi:hypothetical protein